MIGRWLPSFRRSGGDYADPDAYYECTCCLTEFEEWATECPVCGQLVVRIVVPPR